jgi:pyrroloquinoline quinone biosynthesis protein B
VLVRVLGSAAGGGVPQWNCGCPNCAATRAGSPNVEARTQSSVAISADGEVWFLLNVSPDIRQQVLSFPELGPGRRSRGTAIGGCLLTDAEIDHTAGLLFLREGGAFEVKSTVPVRRWLHHDLPLGPVLARFAERPWSDLPVDEPIELASPQRGASGLWVRAFETGRHVPRFVSGAPEAAGAVVGLAIEDSRSGGKLVYAPGIESLGAPLRKAAEDADCILLDGTFWSDDELIGLGIGDRTARQMGHLPVGGPAGSLEWLAEQSARRRIYIHINNTNPMLAQGSPQRRMVEERGMAIAADGDAFQL